MCYYLKFYFYFVHLRELKVIERPRGATSCAVKDATIAPSRLTSNCSVMKSRAAELQCMQCNKVAAA